MPPDPDSAEVWLKFVAVEDSNVGALAPDTITCVMTFYNEYRFFPEALDSALVNFSPSRILVIDDCSRIEESEQAEKHCAAQAVSYRRLSKNRGLSGARMAGLDLVQTPYVMFLDSDDVLDNGYAAKLAVALGEEHAFAMGVQRFFSESPGDDVRSWPTLPKARQDCVDEPCICGAGVLHRVQLLRALGGFRLRWGGRFEDWDLGLRMVDRGYRGVSVRDAAYWYRRRPGTLTTQITPERRAAIDLAICVDYRRLVRSLTSEGEFLSRRFFPLLAQFLRRSDLRGLGRLWSECRHLLGATGLIGAAALAPAGLRWVRRSR